MEIIWISFAVINVENATIFIAWSHRSKSLLKSEDMGGIVSIVMKKLTRIGI